MQKKGQCSGQAHAPRILWFYGWRWLAVLLLALGAAGPTWASCATPQTISVASGGSYTFTCEEADFGWNSPAPIGPSHGSLSYPPLDLVYTNNGDGALSDTFTAQNGYGTAIVVNVIVAPAASPITVSPASLPTPTVGVGYSQTLSATGGTSPYAYSIGSGSLPPGLSLTPGGVIAGTATGAGAYSFTVHVVDSTSGTAQTTDKTYGFTIAAPALTVAPGSAPNGTINQPYSVQFSTSGGTAPYTYSVDSGSLPAGLTLSPSGLLTGTPTTANSYSFTIKSQDSTTSSAGGGVVYFVAPSYSIVISSASVPGAPTIGTATAGNAQATVTFSPPASDGGAAISGYTATSSPGGITASGSASPITVTGLTNGTAYTFTVAATNSVGTGAASAASNSVTPLAPPTISVTPTSVSAGTAGTAYPSTNFTASGGTAPYSYSISTGSLPTGMSLSSGGTLSGTPTVAGTFNFTVQAKDANNVTGTTPSIALTVNAPTITVTPNTVSNATVGVAYTPTSFSASGGNGTYTYSVSAGSLPAGMNLSSSGTLSGTPTEAGPFNFTVQAKDGNNFTGSTSSISMTVNAPTITVGPGVISNLQVGVPYSQQFTASGGTQGSGYTFAASGTVPVGLTLSSTGLLSGTPTSATSSASFTVTATDHSTGTGAPFSGSQGYTVSVAAPTLSISPASGTTLTAATQGSSYNLPFTASGGTPNYSYQITGGTLPNGLSLSNGGQLSGTPTEAGTFNFNVTATDSSTGTGSPFTVSGSYTLDVQPIVPVANPVTINVPYSSTANVVSTSFSGGTPTSVAIASPASHGTATASGTTLTYTPTAGYTGTDSFTYTGTSTAGTSAPATVSVTVSAPTLSITAGNSLTAQVGQPYTQTFTFSGGQAPYQGYSITGIPAGLSVTGFNNTSITISGTPTVSGSFTLGVSGTDSSTGTNAPFNVNQSFALQINQASISLSPGTLNSLTVGVAYNQAFTASGGIAPYTYAVTSGALPAGIALSSDGALSGTPTAGGSFTFQVTATDSSTGSGSPATASVTYNGTVTAPTIALTPGTLPSGQQGTAYSQNLSATGGIGPYTYAVTAGTLPTGMSLSPTGALSGTPTAAGSYNFTATATDSSTGTGPYSGSQAYALSVASNPPIVNDDTASTPSQQPVTVNVTSNDTGSISSVAVAQAPAHGTATVNGTSIVYSPAGTYFGSDSFTYTATGPGGTSAAATVTMTVTPLAVPTVTQQSITVAAGQSTSIDTTAGATGGPYTAAAVASAPGAGSATVSGTTITYSASPDASGAGAQTFTYTLSNAYGTSQPGTVNVQVTSPAITVTPAALAGNVQAGVSYSQNLSASGGTAPYTYSVSSGALPAGLTLSSNGVLAGTPSASGTFQFTATATDDHGFRGSQSYTLAVQVAVPEAVNDSASTPSQQAVTIPVTSNDTGVISSIALVQAPAHGSASVSGTSVVYTPTGTFFGTDTLTYSATGPGGTSAPATVTITVTPLAVPVATAKTATTLAGKAVTIHATQGATGGPFTAVALTSTPASGTAVVSGEDIIYTPALDASGAVSFSYTLSNAYGVSQPAQITVQVNPVPQVVAQTVDALAGTTVRVDLTQQARGGPFTAANLISVSPAAAGSGTIVRNGDSYQLDFATAASFSGVAQIHFTLSNAYATSAPGIITVNVTARPDPSKDAEVLGILGAQVDATRRFASGQINNFQRRLEGLHGNGAMSAFSNGLSFMSGSAMRRRGELGSVDHNRVGDELQRRYLVQPDDAPAITDGHPAGGRRPDSLSFWAGGAVNFGTQKLGGSANGVDFTTSGISLGADKRLSSAFALGVGLGYGHDASDIGHDGSRSTANSYNVATYASFHPSESTFVDGLIGYQWLSFDARRYVSATGGQVAGSRNGTQWFGSLSAGYEHRDEHMLLSPYGRLDMASARLDAYTEHGDALYSLRYDQQTVKTTTGSVGLRLNYPLKRDFGTLAPQVRVEYQHDFQGSSIATMRYADLLSGPLYRANIGSQSRNHTLLGVGLQLQTWHGLMFRVEYQNLFDHSSRNNQSILLGLEAPFNP